MPMSYSYGLSIINTHLFNGASIVLTNKTMMEKGFWSLFSNTKVTTFGGVPFIYKMLKRLKFSEMNLGTLKYITQAGGRLELSLVDYFTSACKKNDFEFYIMYGQTEATARMSVISFNDMNDKKGSIGKAIPGGSFILIDEQGHEVIEDGIGELVYFGDNVSMGYAENYSDLVLKDVNKRRLKTGDIARQDSDGYYYILGRTKRFVKIFGVRTGLDEVENFLNDKGLECVCSGSDDDLKIYSTDSDSIDKIYKFISESRLIHHKGYSVHFIDSIPRNDSGKVMYSHL
jgi:acyl-coenzyme A synthetase/AMP-(fatty) acid ligase